METLLDILGAESETAINVLNKMKWLLIQVNFRQWFSVDIKKNKLKTNRAETKGQNSVTLLGVEMDNEVNLNSHLSKFCKEAGNKTNAISGIQSFLGQKEIEALANEFVYSSFNCCS